MEVDLETRLNRAFCQNRDDEVINLCNLATEGALSKCSIHNHTVLHLACYYRKFQLAENFVNQLPENLLGRLTARTNDWGNTVLHDASASNKGLELVKKLLQKAPELLLVRNKWGETAIFQTTRYGKRKNFEFLAGEVDKFCEVQKVFGHLQFFQRDDKTTILHMAILAGNFDMALMIAKKYPQLFGIKAQERVTALQLLACCPTAFKSGTKLGVFKKFVYSSVSSGEKETMRDDRRKRHNIIQRALIFLIGADGPRCMLPVIEEVRMVKKGHEDALKLAKILIQSDTSWKDTFKPCVEVTPVIRGNSMSGDKFGKTNSITKPHRVNKKETSELRQTEIGCYGGGKSTTESSYQQQEYDIESGKTSQSSNTSESDEAPLLLAAERGCIEIVEEILEVFPQAVGYLNHDQKNLFHVAIKFRNLRVFKLVERELPLVRGLLRDTDNKGNSILHMVALPRETCVNAQLKSPVVQLSEELLLLEVHIGITSDLYCLLSAQNPIIEWMLIGKALKLWILVSSVKKPTQSSLN